MQHIVWAKQKQKKSPLVRKSRYFCRARKKQQRAAVRHHVGVRDNATVSENGERQNWKEGRGKKNRREKEIDF
jgi:hypothetical protein